MSDSESDDLNNSKSGHGLKPAINNDLKATKTLKSILNMVREQGLIEFTEPKSLEEDIRGWVNSNFRQSKNKDEYVKVFKFIYLMPNAKAMNATDIVREIHSEFETNLSARTLRKEVKKFLFKYNFPHQR